MNAAVEIDPARQATAADRVAHLLTEADALERTAASMRAQAASIAYTWGLDTESPSV